MTNDEPVDFSPVWSPDGEWLYWVSARGGSMAIWRVAIDELTGATRGEPQQITTGGPSEPGMLSISADGSRLLYTETLTLSSIVASDFNPDTLSVSGPEVPIVEGTRRLLDFDVSGDGAWLAYRTEGARQDIFVARTDGTNERQITDDFAKDWAPRWSPDGARIVVYTNASGAYQIWTMNPDGSGRRRLTEMDRSPINPVWSPDGTKIIAYDDFESYFIDADTLFEKQELETIPRIPEYDAAFRATDWHPDGRLIAGDYPRRVSSLEHDLLYLYRVEEREFEFLTEGAGGYWMADGRRLIARVSRRQEFFAIDTVTREKHALDVPAVHRIRLSPDNRRAYLGRVSAESDIWMVEMYQSR